MPVVGSVGYGRVVLRWGAAEHVLDEEMWALLG